MAVTAVPRRSLSMHASDGRIPSSIMGGETGRPLLVGTAEVSAGAEMSRAVSAARSL
jgi:hypothetical protein